MSDLGFRAAAPDGRNFYRADTRHYTHAVLAKPNAEWKRQEARDRHTWHLGWYFRCTDIIRNGTASEPGERRNYEDDAIDLAMAHAEVDGYDSAEAYAEAHLARRLAEIGDNEAAGKYEAYHEIGWCIRPDLAEGKAITARNSGRYADVVIAPAERLP